MTIPFLTENIADKIESLASESIAIYGTTAFWTIHPDFYQSPHLLDVLKREKSYFIVDISEPTIVENLVAYSERGGNLYIYLQRAKDKLYKYNHLLHSKIMLFEHQNSEYTLLLGSANMTTRAIKGINKEAGVQISLRESDVLLQEIKDYLHNIKRNSVKVEPSNLGLYKFIQDQGNLNNYFENCPLIYLAAKDEEYYKLIPGNIIQMLGMNDETHQFYNKIETLNNRIALLVENIETNDIKVCVCGLKSIGEVNVNNPETYQKDYEQRLLFYIGLSKSNGACTPSYVFPSMKIKTQMFYIADFHAELIIEEIYTNVYLNDFSIKKKINPWQEIDIISSNEDLILDSDFGGLEGRLPEKADRRNYGAKITIEQINKEIFSAGYFKSIENELSPSKLKLEKIYPPSFNTNYIEKSKEINNWIASINLSSPERNLLKEHIDNELVELFYKNKKEKQVINKNIRIFKPGVVYKNDKIK